MLKKSLIVLISLIFVIGFMGCYSSMSDSNDSKSIESSKSADEYSAVNFQKGTISSNPGDIEWYFHVPSGMKKNTARPLVVAFHGCTQQVADYKDGSGWSVLADKYKFYVIYPVQNANNNGYLCFNWGGDPNTNTTNMDPAGVLRMGEPYTWKGNGSFNSNPGDESGSVINMVNKMKADYNVGAVHTTGLSAGGYMANLMLAVYPDVFSSGAIMAGGPYLCGESGLNPVSIDSNNNFACMRGEITKTPQEWADLVMSHTNYNKPSSVSWPKVQIWQGTSDWTVYPKNADDLVSQWTTVHGISTSPSETTTLKGHEYKKYKDTSGKSLLEVIMVNGMGHAIAVDPGSGDDQGGDSIKTYADDMGVYSSYYAAVFFGLTATNEAPNVTITAPANLSRVDIPFTINATASDDKAVTKVEFSVNNTVVCTDTSAPYSCEVSGYSSDVALTIVATAFDAENATGTDTVTVNPQPMVNVTAPENGIEVSGSITVKVDLYAVDSVNVTINGNSGCTINSSPYECAIDISSYDEGAVLNIKAEGVVNGSVVFTDNDTSVTVQTFVCQVFTATNMEHVAAGRAESYSQYYSEYTRTIGSGEDLGLLGSQYYSATTTVSETAPGYFEKGSKCGSDGDCITAKNREHIDAGRAYECGSSWFPQACAVGTDQVLGYASQYYDPGSSVKETAGGWELCE